MASPKRRSFKKGRVILSALNKANANIEMLFIIVLCARKRKMWVKMSKKKKNKKKAWLVRRRK